MRRVPGIVLGGRWYGSGEAYRLEMGDEAFARACALPDPIRILRQPPQTDQLPLVDADKFKGRKLTPEELYERARG